MATAAACYTASCEALLIPPDADTYPRGRQIAAPPAPDALVPTAAVETAPTEEADASEAPSETAGKSPEEIREMMKARADAAKKKKGKSSTASSAAASAAEEVKKRAAANKKKKDKSHCVQLRLNPGYPIETRLHCSDTLTWCQCACVRTLCSQTTRRRVFSVLHNGFFTSDATLLFSEALGVRNLQATDHGDRRESAIGAGDVALAGTTAVVLRYRHLVWTATMLAPV